jgi:hypothetical protein
MVWGLTMLVEKGVTETNSFNTGSVVIWVAAITIIDLLVFLTLRKLKPIP